MPNRKFFQLLLFLSFCLFVGGAGFPDPYRLLAWAAAAILLFILMTVEIVAGITCSWGWKIKGDLSLATMRRSLSAGSNPVRSREWFVVLIFLWVTLLFTVVALFFTVPWSYELHFPLYFIITGIVMFCGKYMTRVVLDRIAINSVDQGRIFTLYLRGFSSDAIPGLVFKNRLLRMVIKIVNILRFRDFLFPVEWRYAREIERFAGPSVAVGGPNEILPRFGFPRIYLSDSEWQSKVKRLIIESTIIVIGAATTHWFEWELMQISQRNELVDKLILLFLPAQLDDKRRQLDVIATHLEPARKVTASMADDSTELICLYPNSYGQWVSIYSLEGDSSAYSDAVIIALHDKLIQDGVFSIPRGK
jgi:hypothetical protein